MNGWLLWFLVGLVMMLGGLLALLNPLAATLTAEQIAAWIFLLSGLLQLVGVFRVQEWTARIWGLLLSVACLWLGISLLFNPLAGVFALTFVVALGFLASGLAKLILGFRIRTTAYFWPTMISGVMSLVLALMVFLNFPQSAAVLLGVLLSIELLISGATMAAFALTLRKAKPI
jgi:uncharacterized membrane protein HdeD (DUF308 family)